MKKINERYISPKLEIIRISKDVITYSENEEWEGPVIKAGEPEEN